jgi:hypothetical protein
MSFSLASVLRQVRTIIQDEDGERYTNQQLIDALNMAIAEMKRIRPDITSLHGTVTGYPFSVGDANDRVLLPVDDEYLAPVVGFISGWVELSDDEFTVDSRASQLLQRFQTQLVAGG